MKVMCDNEEIVIEDVNWDEEKEYIRDDINLEDTMDLTSIIGDNHE